MASRMLRSSSSTVRPVEMHPSKSGLWKAPRGIGAQRPARGRELRPRTGPVHRRRLRPHRANLLQAIETIPEVPVVASYALVGMAAEGYPANATTEAMVHDIARQQRVDGSWRNGDRRPPLGYSDTTATALSLRSLQLYGPPGRRREFDDRIARARRWLLSLGPRTTEDRAFQLLGLSWSEASRAELQEAARALIAEQRPDGAWAQRPTLSSDAYATGQALVALQQAAGLPASDPIYRQGADFLLRTQLEDGSWHVPTRAMGFQPYFESGFPHGPDQWISAAATAWATMALLGKHLPDPLHKPRSDTEQQEHSAAPPQALSRQPSAIGRTRRGARRVTPE